MSMKIPCKFQAKSIDSCATVRTSLWRRLDAPQCTTDYVEDVWTTEQHRPDGRSISIQYRVGFQKSTMLGTLCKLSGRRGNMSGRCPTFQNIPVFCSKAGMSYSEDRSNARPSHPDMNLIKIKLRCFWKDITEDCPDMANFHPDAQQPEPESQQF
jgi:hypothetical protein